MGGTEHELTWQYVDKWATEKPNREAIVFGDRRLTWADVKREMDAVAKAMLDAGVGKGDRVGMIAMACPEFIVTFMAANKIGACWLGMSPKFRPPELRFMIDDCQPKIIFTLDRYMDVELSETFSKLNWQETSVETVVVLGEAFEGTESYEQFVARGAGLPDEPLRERSAETRPDDHALLMYTSGSTGKPKGVLHTHKSILANVDVQTSVWDFGDDARCLLHFPINHVAADVEMGFASVYKGHTLVMMDRFDPVETLRTIERERITFFGQVPAMYLLQMSLPDWHTTDFSSVEAFVWGGAAGPKDMLRALAQVAESVGAKMVTGYGSTEVCGFVTYSTPDDDLDLLCRTAGKVAEPFEMKIVDEEANELPAGEIGEVCMRGDFLMQGYLNRPEATAEVFDDDGWYRTSDLGYVDEYGNLFLSGRKSEMFKSGGENVFPREVEQVLESHPGVALAAVIGVPDPMYQEVGRAYVLPMPGQEVTEDALRSLCKEHLANFKVPKTLVIRPDLPLLPNGKVNKMVLQEELRATTP